MLSALEQRVAAVESSITRVLGGISRILTVISDMKIRVDGETVVETQDATKANPPGEVDAANSRPPVKQLHADADAAGVGSGTAAARSKSNPHPRPQTVPHRGASPRHPLVLHDDASSRSTENTVADVRTPNRPVGPGTRVHNNPRRRSLPYECRLAVGRSESLKGKAVPIPDAESPSIMPMYKDPPGYETLADFGTASDPPYKLPALQPKKKPVSVCTLG